MVPTVCGYQQYGAPTTGKSQLYSKVRKKSVTVVYLTSWTLKCHPKMGDTWRHHEHPFTHSVLRNSKGNTKTTRGVPTQRVSPAVVQRSILKCWFLSHREAKQRRVYYRLLMDNNWRGTPILRNHNMFPHQFAGHNYIVCCTASLYGRVFFRELASVVCYHSFIFFPRSYARMMTMIIPEAVNL